MNHDVISDKQILLPQNASSYVTTVLVCQNNLIRSGISHILSGTRFVLSDETLEQRSELVGLCLIHADQAADEVSATAERLKSQWPSARVVLLTEAMEPAAMMQALQAGLDGLCSTAMSREPLITALELVMLGETFIAPAFTFRLADEATRRQQARPNAAIVVGPAADAVANNLSPREAMILRHLTQGASNKLIARELGLAEATVKVHLKAILRKVRAANRTQAAMWARQHMGLAANDGMLIAAE
jgi:two-component system nitrate/nitrite response regulator NarL